MESIHDQRSWTHETRIGLNFAITPRATPAVCAQAQVNFFVASLDKIEALVGAFEDNVAQEVFLATQGMVEDLAELLTKQQPIVQMVVELLGPPLAAESPEIAQFRQRLYLAVERREAAIEALAEQLGPLQEEMVRLRQATKMLQDWKRVWLAPEQETSARLPTSYA